jgi:DNA-binding transcriptional LysR family regulator
MGSFVDDLKILVLLVSAVLVDVCQSTGRKQYVDHLKIYAMKDPIDSRQLQIFVVLARSGSLRSAAAELFLTNSAISHSIHALESSLDTKLFHRPGKFLELTGKGHLLLKEAPGILASMDRIRLQLLGEDSMHSASLRTAVSFNFARYMLPEVVSEWQLCFPKGKLIARVADRDTCVKWMSDDAVDATVMVDPPIEPEFSVDNLFEDELRLMVSADSPLANQAVVNMRSLRGKTFLTSRIQSHTTQMVLTEMRRQGCCFHETLELGNIDTVFEMVKLGGGIALVPDWIIDRRARDIHVVSRPLDNIHLVRRWGHVRRAGGEHTLAARTFLRLCRRVTGNLAVNMSAAMFYFGISPFCDFDWLQYAAV